MGRPAERAEAEEFADGVGRLDRREYIIGPEVLPPFLADVRRDHSHDGS